jgi:hypothetical protein
MSAEMIAGAALLVSLLSIALHLFQMRRDPNVPEV